MFKRLLFAAMLALFAAVWCSAAPSKKTEYTTKAGKYTVVAKTNCPGAWTKVGKEVKIAVRVDSELPGFAGAQLFVNGLEQGKPQTVKFGETAEFSVTAKTPGTVSVICTIMDENKKPVLNFRKRRIVGGLGVRVDPWKIRPGNPKCPADFDEFWAKKRAELDAVPVKATRKEVKLSAKDAAKYPNVVCYDVKVDCAGGAPVSGYLCMPRGAEPKSLPAVVFYHGAGVRSAVKRPDYGSKAIAFDVNAHGIENGKPAKFYSALSKGKLSSYWHRGYDDHKNIYFVGMYLRVMRALDYAKSLPEWDGKTLIVCGGSQGGAQTMAAAALDKQVTLAVPGVPALCDLGGKLAKRRPGWPIHFMKPFEKQTDPALIGEAAYVDGVFMAQRIKCPVFFSTGGIDNTCHATSVFAAYNVVPGKDGKNKHILYHPTGDHGSSPSKPGYTLIKKTIGLE